MNTLFIHWYFTPEVFPHAAIGIRWYGVLFALSFVSAYLIMYRIFKKEGIAVKTLDDLTLYIGIGTVIGARLGHCLFYEPEIYLKEPLRILKVWEGGLASHGAAIGILLALWLFVRKYKYSYMDLLDRLAIVIPLSGAFIRLGNLANSEIYGKVTSLPWGFYFHNSMEIAHRAEPHHPTQIYEALAYVLMTLLLWFLYRRGLAEKRGRMFGWFLILLFAFRFVVEFVKEPQVAFENKLLLNMGQLLSVPFIITGILIVVMAGRKNTDASGLKLSNTAEPAKNTDESTGEPNQ
jgi:phosphatidylglycerol---prolipoprotein diacylglyceryl transferase